MAKVQINIENLVALLKAHTDLSKSSKMSNYMQNKFTFLGIQTPQRRELIKPFLDNLKDKSSKEIFVIVDFLWQLPEREFQYIAIDILDYHKKNLNISDLNYLLKLVKIKSWWDSVDSLASPTSPTIINFY